MNMMILPTLLFLAALTTALMVLGVAWAQLVPAYRSLRRQLDGVPDALPLRTRVSAPPLRPRSYGPFWARVQAAPASVPARRPRQHVHYA